MEMFVLDSSDHSQTISKNALVALFTDGRAPVGSKYKVNWLEPSQTKGRMGEIAGLVV